MSGICVYALLRRRLVFGIVFGLVLRAFFACRWRRCHYAGVARNEQLAALTAATDKDDNKRYGKDAKKEFHDGRPVPAETRL